MTGFVNAAICAKCGGQCCKQLPGACHPSDFGVPGADGEQRLRAALASGKYAIDWWEGDVRGYLYGHPEYRDRCFFVRPACKRHEGELFENAWTGMCTFYDVTKGCALKLEERPTECRMLEPGDHDQGQVCRGHSGGKEQSVREWLTFTEILDAISEEDCKRRC